MLGIVMGIKLTMTSLALPERRDLRVDLVPSVTGRLVSMARSIEQRKVHTFARLHHKRETRIDGVRRLLALLRCHFEEFLKV